MPSGSLRTRLLGGIHEISASQWDALFASPYPFIRHHYLAALEQHGCVGGQSGWEPAHLIIEDAQGTLRAAAPLYRKQHSYGEFVFDWAWADASHRIGQPYYPKWLSAIPFVPATGPRLAYCDSSAQQALMEQLAALSEQDQASSCHLLFLPPDQAQSMRSNGFLLRNDIQFHWRNHGYSDFDAFLSALSSAKRKKLRRERKRVSDQGISFEISDGSDLSQTQWQRIFALYANTYHERGMWPYLNLEFLHALRAMPDRPLRLVLAYDGQELVAMALNLRGGDRLYGRHWGAAANYDALHFECCYYQGIEICLREGLNHFDAGTQGEHKRSRGFEPVITHSLHRLRDPRLHDAVDRYLQQERAVIAARYEDLMQHTPYRQQTGEASTPD